jgi:hypothetical protein
MPGAGVLPPFYLVGALQPDNAPIPDEELLRGNLIGER